MQIKSAKNAGTRKFICFVHYERPPTFIFPTAEVGALIILGKDWNTYFPKIKKSYVRLRGQRIKMYFADKFIWVPIGHSIARKTGISAHEEIGSSRFNTTGMPAIAVKSDKENKYKHENFYTEANNQQSMY